jgi:2-phospho-L-lactate transferase/gluconeogenesis factor (CofD/UPF0052 family)
VSPASPRTAVAMFSGGRGGASIAGQLLRTPGVDLSLLINGYDNGLSTGALRRYLPGMLGPSDFRKNLLLHLDPGDSRAMVLEHRLPAGAGRADLDTLESSIPGWTGLPAPVRAAVAADLATFRRRLEQRPHGLDLADCAVGNLVFAGAYLRAGGAFNAAVRSCARTFGSPAQLLNVTNGENAFLVARKQDGRLLADEAEIVAAQDGTAITDLFLLREPLAGRLALDRQRARVSLNPEARDAIARADVIVYGPGTPHSSLLPSYLTPGLADAIAASRASARVFVVNMRHDHDVQGLSAPALVDLTLAYLGDPGNDRRTVTHVLSHRAAPSAGTPVVPAEVAARGSWAGARWITADLGDPERPGVHSGRRTVDLLVGIAREASLVRLG